MLRQPLGPTEGPRCGVGQTADDAVERNRQQHVAARQADVLKDHVPVGLLADTVKYLYMHSFGS